MSRIDPDTKVRQARYAARFPGWRESQSAYRCPRQVVGKRCLMPYTCMCDWGKPNYLFDHVRLWVLPNGGGRVLTSEPYHVDLRQLENYRRECEIIGVAIDTSDDSPWFPGYTTLLIFRSIS